MVALTLAMVLSACDLGPSPTPTPTVPSPTAPPTVPASPQPSPIPTAKSQPTNTIAPSPEPTATATPVPTQPPAPTKVTFKYAAPKLKEPSNGGGYGGQLLWEMVPVTVTLAADEYYHISVHSVHNKELRHWGFDTAIGKKDGKLLLPREQFGDKDNNWKTLSDTGEFTWEVQVMRKLDSGGGVPISPPSETWSFKWYMSTD
jgi:hypothetical protein